jgi:hypothetical protein
MLHKYFSAFSLWLVSQVLPVFKQVGASVQVCSSVCLRNITNISFCSGIDRLRRFFISCRDHSPVFYAPRSSLLREVRQICTTGSYFKGGSRCFHSYWRRGNCQFPNRVSVHLPHRYLQPDILARFIMTISAWTEPGCKNAANDPNAKKGDQFKNALAGWCDTKKAGAIFTWLAFSKFLSCSPSVPFTNLA